MEPVKRWWFETLPLGRIAAFRTIAYGFIFIDVFLTTSWVANHAHIPPELYQPLFIARILNLPTPTYAVVVGVEVALLLCAAIALRGWAPRAAGAAVFFLYLAWMLIAMSYGKVDHDRFAFLIALAVLPTVRPAAWGEKTETQDAGWALRCVQVAVVLTYFLATFAKLRFGGLEWVNGATLMRAVLRRGTFLVDPLAVENPWILHAAQWFIVAFELASPLMLLRSWIGKLYVRAAFVFHAITYASITIVFLPHVVCLLTFLPLENIRLGARIRQRLPRVAPTPGRGG